MVSNKRLYLAIGAILIVIFLACFLIGSFFGIRSADELVKSKDAEIARLTTVIENKESEATNYLNEYNTLSEKVRVYNTVIAKYKSIIQKEKKNASLIIAPKDIKETIERLNKLGLKAEVKCNGK